MGHTQIIFIARKYSVHLPLFSVSKSKSCRGDDSRTHDIRLRGPVPECVLTAAEDI